MLKESVTQNPSDCYEFIRVSRFRLNFEPRCHQSVIRNKLQKQPMAVVLKNSWSENSQDYVCDGNCFQKNCKVEKKQVPQRMFFWKILGIANSVIR